MGKHTQTDKDLNLAALPHLQAGNMEEAARILAASSPNELKVLRLSNG